MNSHINGFSPKTHSPRSNAPAQRGPQPRAQSERAPAGDTVRLTDSAQNLKQLEQTLTETPAVDSTRVDAIRDAIANGQFEVDAGRIADGLLRSDQALAKAGS